MSRILLLLNHKENCRLLSEWLVERYEVVLPNYNVDIEQQAAELLAQPFDLCIADGSALARLREQVKATREAQQPVFLPFMLITSRQDIGMATDSLQHLVDELIISPIEKVELQVRIKVLLRSRSMSKELKAANEQLQCEIEERTHTEEALRQTESRYRAIVEDQTELISRSLPDGTITFVNEPYCRYFSKQREELIGKSFKPLVYEKDHKKVAQHFASLNKQNPIGKFEHRVITPTGEIRWQQWTDRAILNSSGEVAEFQSVGRDITERKQAETEIRKALLKEKELNEFKSSFISMVSHDFRNPLNVISAATQILERYGEKWSAEKKQEFFQRIYNAIKKMNEMLEDVLIIGRADAGKLKLEQVPLKLEEFCQDLVSEFQLSVGEKYQVAFVSQYNGTAIVDQKLLRSILSNLLSNAIKYSHKGSKIEFKLGHQSSKVVFEIRDQGIGIPEEFQQQLFETFSRANNVDSIPGTGLGLAIVKRCVDIHGGAIAVESQVGVGTTFTVTLPSGRGAGSGGAGEQGRGGDS